jgi:hypothetical protein
MNVFVGIRIGTCTTITYYGILPFISIYLKTNPY